MTKHHPATVEDRLDAIGWGFLFLLIAALALPTGAGEYASVAAVGILILGLNVYRASAQLEVSWFGLVLGASCAVAGTAALAGLRADLIVVFFVVAALVTIAAAIVPQAARAR